MQPAPEGVRLEVTAESCLAVALWFEPASPRWMIRPTTMSAPGSRRSNSSRAATAPGVERRRAEIGQPVAGREVRIDEDVGHAPCVEFAGERFDHLREERGDHRAVVLLAAQRLQQAFERRTVVLVEADAADHDVVTRGSASGAAIPASKSAQYSPGAKRGWTAHKVYLRPDASERAIRLGR